MNRVVGEMLRRLLRAMKVIPPASDVEPFAFRPTKSPSARYELRVNDEPLPVTDLVGQAGTLLDYYLQLDSLSCCSVLGGFVICADGEVAMGETDEVSMSQTWLPAILRLQRGEDCVSVWAWEESNMTLTRDREFLEMEDVHHSGTIVCARVRFPFCDFVRAILNASRPMASFVAELHSAIDRYRSDPSFSQEAETLERLQFLREEFSADWPNWIAESESLLADVGT